MRGFINLTTVIAIAIASIVGGGIVFFSQDGGVGAPPTGTFHKDLNPLADSTYYVGTSTPSNNAWKGVVSDEFCLTGDNCISVWPSGGSSDHTFPFDVASDWGGVSTSTTVVFDGGIGATASSTLATTTLTGDLDSNKAARFSRSPNAFNTTNDYTTLVIDGDSTGAGIFGGRANASHEPFTILGAWDSGTGRSLNWGGGAWDAPDATSQSFFTAPTYTETNNTGVLRMVIFPSGNVNIGDDATDPSVKFRVEGNATLKSDAPVLTLEDTGGTIDWTQTVDGGNLTIAPSSLSTAANEKLIINAPINLSGSLPDGFNASEYSQILFNYDQTSGSGIAHQVQSVTVDGTLTYTDTIPIYRAFMTKADFVNAGGGSSSRWELFNSFNNLQTLDAGSPLWGRVSFNSQNNIQNHTGASKTITMDAAGGSQSAISFWAHDTYNVSNANSVTTVNEHNGFRSGGGTSGSGAGTSITVTDWNDFRVANLSTNLSNTTITNRNNLYIPDDTDTDITNVNGIRSLLSNASGRKFINHTGTAPSYFKGTIHASSTAVTSASTTQETITDLFIGGDHLTELVGNGLTTSGTQLNATLGTTVAPAELSNSDFGDFTCASGTCTLDANVIDDTHIDWGTGSNQISIADFSGNQISGALVWNFGGATSFELPNSANPTVNAAGEIAINTTIASSSLRFYDGTSEQALYPDNSSSSIYASSTLALDGGYSPTATSTYILANYPRGVTLTSLYCKVSRGSGSATVEIGNGTASSTINCTTTGTENTTDITFNPRDDYMISFGNAASTKEDTLFTVTDQIIINAD